MVRSPGLCTMKDLNSLFFHLTPRGQLELIVRQATTALKKQMHFPRQCLD